MLNMGLLVCCSLPYVIISTPDNLQYGENLVRRQP